ncbi:MAG: DUF1385 domain-containing protein [Candidatus Eisenbacteria bacterium]
MGSGMEGAETKTAGAPTDRLGKTMFNKIGGQAVIEGVMMRAPGVVATAVRRPDGSIAIRRREFRSVVEKFRFLRLPILRGAVVLVESLGLGMSALMWSAEEAADEPDKKKRDEKENGKGGGKEGGHGWTLWLTLVLSLAIGIGFFFYLPLLVTEWLGVEGGVAFNLVDGVIRLLFLLAYVKAISLWGEMRRVLAYHGAEHKSIYNLESGLDLAVGNAQGFTTLHPRCGTSFLFIVMMTSVIVFCFLGRPDSIQDRLLRLAFVPVVGGISYEFLKISGKWADRRWMKPFIRPGLFLQTMTTREPDDDQVEVALTAMRSALGDRVDDREGILSDVG